MSKVAKPVTIIVTESEMLEWETFKAMSAQGHQIVDLQYLIESWMPPTFPPLALVMGPRAHYLVEGMEACIPVALKKARVELYPKGDGA